MHLITKIQGMKDNIHIYLHSWPSREIQSARYLCHFPPQHVIGSGGGGLPQQFSQGHKKDYMSERGLLAVWGLRTAM